MGDEKRHSPRVPLEAEVKYQSVGEFISDWITNVSAGGVFIKTEKPLDVGTRVKTQFNLPGTPLFDLAGDVRWVREKADGEENPRGMGIEFIDISDSIRIQIDAYMKISARSEAHGEV